MKKIRSRLKTSEKIKVQRFRGRYFYEDFIPVTSRKVTVTVVLEFLSGEALYCTGELSSTFSIEGCYYEKVLLPHVRLFRGVIGPDFIFMDDNARPHRTLAVDDLLESEDITRMDWPAYSPNLSPIERVWDALGRRIAARLHHLDNTQELKQMLIEEWALLPPEMLHQLVLCMRRRCGATIAVRVGHIPY
ncbi:transposable element Tcb2 transposase [Trichonephila clavipes]|nr:transposable element Tcb2 transposase [Trichonephila clavipes]